MIYTLERTQILKSTLEKVWPFFSSPNNLLLITPPSLKFKILTEIRDEPIHTGMKIQYTVKPFFNIPLPWTTLISEVNPPYSFTDLQVKGPYKLWEHKHFFKQTTRGVEMKDFVRYELPFGVLGNIAHAIKVKKQLEEIFMFRKKVVAEIFPD